MSAAESSQPAEQRREALKQVFEQAQRCVRCQELATTRKNVVFGAGNADAELMFVGEAPGASEDELGLPFVGRAGKLLETLLEEIGLERRDVFIANVLKCLRYNSRVQLADGSWERIGRLVRSRYSGSVMAVDAEGLLVQRRVTGWHETPVGDRRVFRLTYASSQQAGVGRVGIEVTGDHPVLTDRGYVPAQELGPSDRIATGQGLSDLAYDVVCGTVLGDGCLQAKGASLSLSHSQRQAEYALFKAELMEELEPCVEERLVAAVAGGPKSYGVVHVRTLAHRALRVLRGEFYRPHKRVPGWMAEGLNERMLAIWFMDDGYARLRSPRRPSAEIATVGFDDRDLQVLLAGLTRLGIPAKASRGRLYFDVDATEALSEKIAPYVPPPMRYKLHPDVAALVPFDTDRLRAGHRRVLFDGVEVEDVTHRERADKTFFCIDVEETHNFVTAGGVVHNCRPPGNRDPLPLEIENCREYLYRQVELIQPRVICSLGNFSTKLLRDDPTGITRLHGKPQELTLGRRTVRLYPIFHPAAALYTPRMLETLREDFARLPELLAQPEPRQPVEGESEALAQATAAREEPARGSSGDQQESASGASGGRQESASRVPDDEQESAGAVDQLGLF